MERQRGKSRRIIMTESFFVWALGFFRLKRGGGVDDEVGIGAALQAAGKAQHGAGALATAWARAAARWTWFNSLSSMQAPAGSRNFSAAMGLDAGFFASVTTASSQHTGLTDATGV